MYRTQLRKFIEADAEKLVALQGRSLQACRDTGQFEAGFWHSPGFNGGKNIFIAENVAGEMVGYAAITSAYYANTLEARVFWIDLRTDPRIDKNFTVKDTLLKRIIQRGYEMKAEENRDRVALGATYFSTGRASIEYLKSRGFKHFETMLAMRLELSAAIENYPLPRGIALKDWRMASRPEKQAYLEARTIAFGYPLQTLNILEHFTQSELWQGGTTLTAFAGEEIIGSVMALSNGLLDYVFVVPEWRGKGIAKALVSAALKFLKHREQPESWLEVYAHNQAAVGLYQSFGFQTFREEISLGALLE